MALAARSSTKLQTFSPSALSTSTGRNSLLVNLRPQLHSMSPRRYCVTAQAASGTTRAVALLPYIVPLLEGARYSNRWFSSTASSAFVDLAEPLKPLQDMYYSSPFFSLVVCLSLWLLVVRNNDVDGYVRFNAAQALILAAFLQLPYWIERILNISLSSELFTLVYAAGLVGLLYSMIRTLLGKDTGLPFLASWASKL